MAKELGDPTENLVLVIYSPQTTVVVDIYGPFSDAKAHFVQEVMEVEDHSEIVKLGFVGLKIDEEWETKEQGRYERSWKTLSTKPMNRAGKTTELAMRTLRLLRGEVCESILILDRNRANVWRRDKEMEDVLRKRGGLDFVVEGEDL